MAPTLNFGAYGLKAVEPDRVTARQIEAARRAMTRHMKRAGQGVDPHLPGCAGDEEADRSAHGSGKGAVEFWAARVKPGRIMFEIDGVSREDVAEEALRLGAAKLPIKTRFVARLGELTVGGTR